MIRQESSHQSQFDYFDHLISTVHFKMIKQVLLLSLLGLALAAPSSKVEPGLAKSLRSNRIANVFVKFGTGNRDIIQSVNTLRFDNRGDKITHLVAALRSLSQSSQANAVALLQSPQSSFSAVTFKQFYVSNELYVKGATLQLIQQLAALSEVTEIREELVVQIDDLTVEGGVTPQAEWNLEKIEAPQAWGLPGGNNGQGVVVANLDTGARHTHEALRNNFRAEYGWHDACGISQVPIDENGHGTLTIGLVAGNPVGVAPGAQWISCRLLCPGVVSTEAMVKDCAEWTLCPSLPDGSNEDCSKAPKVVSNSWAINRSDNDFYDDNIAAWKAAGIIPVFALGNDGPMCSTGISPGDRSVIGVGSTTVEDNMSGFSAVGPAANNVIKPEIAAPGSSVRSSHSESDSAYVSASGTSLACPQVSGAVALLLSSNPNLNYDQVKELLQQNTDTRGLGDTGAVCGGRNSTTFPNNHYGHGRLNARKALEAAINRF